MLRYTIRRILWIIPVILGVAILIFSIMYAVPGDPTLAILGSDATQEQREAKKEELGLNDPYLVQLGRFMYQTFIKGDLGTSYVYGTSVMKEMLSRLPRTLLLGMSMVVVQVIVGIPLGIWAATHHNGLADRICMLIALLGVSIPQFWFALMLVIVFSLNLGWLPSHGIGGIQYYILPILAGCLGGLATTARQTRSSMLEVIHSDYISTARAKGVSEHDVIWKHALPNALIPIITIVGHGIGMSLAGTVLIETVFSIPGIGIYMTAAIGNRDYPVIRGSVVLYAAMFAIVMLIVDLVYAFVDPRIKSQYEGSVKRRRRKNNG